MLTLVWVRSHALPAAAVIERCITTFLTISVLLLGFVLCTLLLLPQLAALQTVSGSDSQAASSIPSDELLTAAVAFPPGSVSKMEENIKAALSSDTKSISMLRTLKLYLERMGADKQVGVGLTGVMACL